MGKEHNHGHKRHNHGHSRGKVNSNNLLIATLLNIIITMVEVAGGIISNSFALLSDALHNFGDTIAIFLAYISNKVSKRPPTQQRTFGFKRIEILAALINGIAMIAICIYLFIEAYYRLKNPTKINGALMVIVATIGLLANFIAMALLQKDKDKNINVKAAYLHLLGDTLSSITVIIGGVFIYFYRIYWLDPLLTFIIGAYVLKEAISILRQAYLILVQATPENLDLEKVRSELECLPEVDNIHHVHAWQLDDVQIHFECHVDLKNDYLISRTETIMFKIKEILKNNYQIDHTTIQFEYNCCDDKSMVKK